MTENNLENLPHEGHAKLAEHHAQMAIILMTYKLLEASRTELLKFQWHLARS